MNLIVVFSLVFLVSVLWAAWSLRDLKSPKNFYPQFEKKVRKILSGVIHLPKA